MLICKYYLRGHCRNGYRCRYRHDNTNQNSIAQVLVQIMLLVPLK